jgi:soluble lytic murein transglycosylase-like protein
MEVLENIKNSIKKDVLADIQKASTFFRGLSIVNTLFYLVAIFAGAHYGLKLIRNTNTNTKTLVEHESDIRLLLKNIEVMNEPAVLLKIVREKAPTLPAEAQCRAANTIYQVCSARGVEVSLACALAEVESGFNPTIHDSGVGAVGWFQVMPSSAMPYMDLQMGGYSREKLRDPITNAICGINIFANLVREALESGNSPDKAIELALGHYNCGPVISSNGYAEKVLRKREIYRERFETSLKELGKS